MSRTVGKPCPWHISNGKTSTLKVKKNLTRAHTHKQHPKVSTQMGRKLTMGFSLPVLDTKKSQRDFFNFLRKKNLRKKEKSHMFKNLKKNTF
jgi:hypothetical protein